MKKFKLIKEYPGSVELGAIRSDCDTPILQKYFINYPEFWEEVIEKDYEILISRVVPQEILSVKRLSDGEVFTVGDLITGHSYTDARVIEKIKIRHDESIRLEQKYGSTELAYATKLKQPLFLTHDGKDIFEGDTVWWVRKESLHYSCFEAHSEISFCSDINVYFLTKAAAENYLVQKSHSLSIEDFWEFDSWGGSPIAKSKRLKRLVKERLNLE
jgi:hypothetical protein